MSATIFTRNENTIILLHSFKLRYGDHVRVLRRSTGDAILGVANHGGETRWRSFPVIGDCSCRTSLFGVSHLVVGDPGGGIATGKVNWPTGGCEFFFFFGGKILTGHWTN